MDKKKTLSVKVITVTAMLTAIATHGLQAVVISLCVRKLLHSRPAAAAAVGVALGAVIMVTGYSLGRAFLYSTPEYAILKLPYQILQALTGAVLSLVTCYGMGLKRTLKQADLLPE